MPADPEIQREEQRTARTQQNRGDSGTGGAAEGNRSVQKSPRNSLEKAERGGGRQQEAGLAFRLLVLIQTTVERRVVVSEMELTAVLLIFVLAFTFPPRFPAVIQTYFPPKDTKNNGRTVSGSASLRRFTDPLQKKSICSKKVYLYNYILSKISVFTKI